MVANLPKKLLYAKLIKHYRLYEPLHALLHAVCLDLSILKHCTDQPTDKHTFWIHAQAGEQKYLVFPIINIFVIKHWTKQDYSRQESRIYKPKFFTIMYRMARHFTTMVSTNSQADPLLQILLD